MRLALCLLLLVGNCAHAQLTLSDPAFVASLAPVSGGISTGLVGRLFYDDFNRVSLGTNWVVDPLYDLQIVDNELAVNGRTNLPTHVAHYVFPTMANTFTVTWRVRTPYYSAHTAGVCVGMFSFRNTLRNYIGMFSMDSGADGRKVIIYKQSSDGTWLTMIKSGQIAYAAGDVMTCMFSRDNMTLRMWASNTTQGSSASVSTNLSGLATGSYVAPGAHAIGIWCYKGSNLLDNLTYTNTAGRGQRPSVLFVGDSITEIYDAQQASNRYANLFAAAKGYPIYVFAGTGGVLTNAIVSVAEIVAYNPQVVALMIGGNDLTLGYGMTSTTNNYKLLTSMLVASNMNVVHLLTTPRDAIDLRPFKNFQVAEYPTSHVDTWTNLYDGGSGMIEAFDSDDVHPNIEGMKAINTNLLNGFGSGLLP